MNDGMSAAEFRVRFPEPSLGAMRLYHVSGTQTYRLLWLTAGVLPEDRRQLRDLIATVLDEVYRGNDTELLRRMSLQLLGLAYPAIDENRPEVRDQIERFLAESGNPVHDDIPY
jgi:hypothetical protein